VTRRSKRELERALADLAADTADAVEYDRDPLGTEGKRTLADVLDADPWDPTDTDAGDALAAIHRRTRTDR
jgi:hypothetical protein